MQLTERYKDAATRPGHANNVERVEDNSLVWGVDGIEYVPTHEYGDPRRNIPARPVFELACEDDELDNRTGAYIGQLFGRIGALNGGNNLNNIS